MNSKTKKVLVPLVAIVFGFLLGAIIMLAFGYNPIWGYEDLFISALGMQEQSVKPCKQWAH